MTTKYYQDNNKFYRIQKRKKNEHTYYGDGKKTTHIINLYVFTYEDTIEENIQGKQVTKDVWDKALNKLINHLLKQL